MIYEIELVVDRKANKKVMPEQPGDVPKTYADITKAKELLGYNPSTDIKQGLQKFYEWYSSKIQV